MVVITFGEAKPLRQRPERIPVFFIGLEGNPDFAAFLRYALDHPGLGKVQ
jgi:hypothetical protein